MVNTNGKPQAPVFHGKEMTVPDDNGDDDE